MKISACCIIKNEEKNLPAYIDGVKDIADEIIITDTGSTDNSLKLLEELKIKYKLNLTVYYFEWINDFATAKNFTLEKASGDWIIFLDADEYFDKKDRKKIRPLLELALNDKNVIGLNTPLLNIDVDKGNAPISQTEQIRIFRKQEDLIFAGAVHEHLWYKGKNSVVFLHSEFLIIHTGYSSSIDDKKIERNNKIIFANKELANDEEPIYYMYLGSAYGDEGKYELAIENFEKAYEWMKKIDHPFLVKYYDLYLKARERLNVSKKEIETIIEEALETTKRHPDILTYKLMFIMDSETPDLKYAEEIAKETIERAKDQKLRSKYLNQTDAHLPYVHYTLGAILKVKGDFEGAKKEFLIALKSYRYRENILTDLLSLLEGNEKESVKILKEYYNKKNETDKEFLAKVFEERPRDNLYKMFSGKDKNSVDYKISEGKITEAIKLAAKELEAAKIANLPPDEFKKNLKEKLYILAISFLFLNINEIENVKRELNLLPPSVIAVILRFYGEDLPQVEGEKASYNAILNMAKIYLPKSLREKFLALKI